MKTCLICNTDAPDDTATCPNDGEASWSAPLDIVEVATVAPDDKPARKRGAR